MVKFIQVFLPGRNRFNKSRIFIDLVKLNPLFFQQFQVFIRSVQCGVYILQTGYGLLLFYRIMKFIDNAEKLFFSQIIMFCPEVQHTYHEYCVNNFWMIRIVNDKLFVILHRIVKMCIIHHAIGFSNLI